MNGLDESIGLAILAGLAGAAMMSVCVALLYPFLREQLQSVSPALRSHLILGLLVMPAVTAISLVIIILSPALDYGPLAHHCHTVQTPDCVPHTLQTYDRTLSLATLLITLTLIAWPVVRRLGTLVRYSVIHRGLRLTARLDRERNVYMIDHRSPLAFSIGLFRPAIFLSTGLADHLEPDELDNVIQHETAHRNRRDSLRLITGEILSTVHGALTGKQLVTDLNLACEQACDEYACDKIGQRLAVAATILKVERLLGSTPLIPAGAIRITGSSVPARINWLLARPQGNDSRMLIHASLSVLVLAVSVFFSAEPLHHLLESIL